MQVSSTANITGDLTNLGKIVSNDTITITALTGLVTNAGTVSAGNDLQLSAHDLVNDAGDAANPAIIGAANSVTLTTAGKLDNLNGSLLAQNGALTIGGAGTTLTNRGLISAAGAVNINTAALANDATLARIEGTAITVKLTGNLANLGTILSIGDTNLTVSGAIANDGTISAAQTLTLNAASYAANSKGARLEALDADLILSGGLSNAGTVLAWETLTLKSGNLHNAATGTIAAGVTVNHIDYAGLIEADIAGDLTNLGQIYSIGTKVLVDGSGEHYRRQSAAVGAQHC